MKINLYEGDLPENIQLSNCIALDSETMGLNPKRDKLCLIQISNGDGICHLVKIDLKVKKPHNLIRILKNNKINKIFHFARFDVAVFKHNFKINIKNIYCTKIASKLARTFSQSHGLKNLVKEVLSIDISKEQQSSYWGANVLDKNQINYAKQDVLYLHKIRQHLDKILKHEERFDVFEKTCRFLPTRCELDNMGWDDIDPFSH